MGVISFSGPARVTLLSLDTEPAYDWLEIGSQRFTGHLDLAQEIDILEEGISTITWYSDWSQTGLGWALEISQLNASAAFPIASNVAPGDEVVVFAAFNDFENGNSSSATITDCKLQSPVSSTSTSLDTKFSLRGSLVAAARLQNSLLLHGVASQVPDLALDMPEAKEVSKSSKQALAPKEINLNSQGKGLGGRVVGSMTLSGWGRSDIDTPAALQSISRALAVGISEKHASVHVHLMTELEEGATVHSTSATLEFEVSPALQTDSSRTFLDRVEAKLILLGMAGSQAERVFHKALTSALPATEPDAQVHASVGAVWQLP